MGASANSLVTIHRTPQSSAPQYAIGNLLYIAQIQSGIELHLIGYQTLEQIETTQCVEILTSGALSQISCHLPPHCGRVEYVKNSSTWFTEIGICIGVGQTPIQVKEDDVTYVKNMYKVYHPILKPTTIKWRHLTRKVGKYPRKHMPRSDYQFRGLHIEDIVMFVLNKENSDDWYIYSAYLHSSFAMYTQKLIIEKPQFNSVDSKVCITTLTQSRIPIILGPMSKKEAIYNSMFTSVFLPGMKTTKLRFVVDHDTFMNGSGYVAFNDDDFVVNCNPSKATMTLLPVTLTSVLNTVGHSVLIITTTILYSLLDAVQYVVRLVSFAVNLYIALIFVCINVYKYRMSLFDSIITSLAMTLVVQYLHGHCNYRYG